MSYSEVVIPYRCLLLDKCKKNLFCGYVRVFLSSSFVSTPRKPLLRGESAMLSSFSRTLVILVAKSKIVRLPRFSQSTAILGAITSGSGRAICSENNVNVIVCKEG